MLTTTATHTAAADGLVARLAEEMTECWRQGQRLHAEHFLDRHPELWNLPPAVMDLIYEEICLRHEHGESVNPHEIFQRFPQWQQQVAVLLDCLNALESPTGLPHAGETFGDFQLLAELGRGGQGCVFVATQSSLGDRPVVLKITPCRGEEHLSLARVQHTHIVPLLSVVDEPSRNLRVLCMPYFGGLTLAAILERLAGRPPNELGGRHILEALDQARFAAPVKLPAGRDPAIPFLERASFVQAVAWIGACLAEALHYAHDRGLVHLDVKPSNVLLTANRQPMLLDFHLARPPLAAGDSGSGFGGTPAYMSPEQKKAMSAIKEQAAIPAVVDGRSDIFSLGLVLKEALNLCPSQVPRGLSDIIAKCLSPDPRRRYQDAGALAGDLWAHLSDLPLKGVANRNLAERWAKWRRRQPHMLSWLGMLAAVLLLGGAAFAVTLVHVNHRVDEARTGLAEGQELLKKGQFADAENVLQHGLSSLQALPGNRDLQREIQGCLQQATQAQLAHELHDIADRFRLLYGSNALPAAKLRALAGPCREFWEKRQLILDRLGKDLDTEMRQRVQLDLQDLAILGANLQVRLAGKDEATAARREALRILAQAEDFFGPNAVLYHERQMYAEAIGQTEMAREAERRALLCPPRTAWEHYALARSFMDGGQLGAAAGQLEKALAIQPGGFWPHFYQGICCYRLDRFEDSALEFTACATLAPNNAGCFYNRALAFMGQGRKDRALHDLSRALQLEPDFAEAAEQMKKLQSQR